MSTLTGPPRLGGIHWRVAHDADPRTAHAAIELALRALANGRARREKRGRRKALDSIPSIAAPGRIAYLLKHNHYDSVSALRRAVRRSKARHELVLAEQLAARGLPVVAPIAAGERRRGLLLTDCWLLIPYCQGARDLLALAREPSLPAGVRHALARDLGTLSRAAHDAGLLQDDFAPNNILYVPGDAPGLRLIDFERARLGARPASDAWRRWMLAKLERALPSASLPQRFRFLVAYAQGDRAAARAWWSAVEAESERLARRDVARWRRHALRDGRRQRRVSCAGLRGFALRELDDAALAAALAAGSARVLRFPDPGPRALGRLWGDARVLAARGLGVPWQAGVARGGDAFLVATPAAAEPADETQTRRLLQRLLRLGTLDAAQLGPQAFVRALDPGPPRALLANPRVFHFATRRRAPDARCAAAAARALARRIFDGCDTADSVPRQTLR